MIDLIDKSNAYSFSKLILNITRYKKQGYKIVGIGYPFYYHEFLGLIKICDFFVDDMNNPATEHWQRRYNINDLSILQKIDKAIILVLSLNRYSLLVEIKNCYSNFKIIYTFNECYYEIITKEEDIENSKYFIYQKYSLSALKIENAILSRNGTLFNISNILLKIGYIKFSDRSEFQNSSRYENQVDTLILGENSKISILLDGKVDIKNCYLDRGAEINVYSGNLNLADVYFGENCRIHVYNELNIGSGTIISWNVNILDGDGHSLYLNGKINNSKAIKIEENVWIGNNVTVLKGVTIGAGSVIGAGSIVTKSIPQKSLAVGNPAKVIKSNIKWEYKYQ